MSNYEELDDALSLVWKRCTREQIQALLRTRKGEEHVRITAQTKDDLVHKNLRGAVEARSLEIEKVFDLIRVSEENGNQHIFYYKPRTKRIADTLIYEEIAQRLWGSGWRKITKFPAIRLMPNDYVYSDFRSDFLNKPRDWLLKIYGHTSVPRSTGNTEVRNGNAIWREYVEEDLRCVLVARWNSPDLLELRVERNQSRGLVDKWHRKLWDMVRRAVSPDQFQEWTLTKAMARLIREQAKNRSIYTFRDASVVDQATNVHAQFETYSDEGNLSASLEARRSIETFLAADGDCNGLTVTWQPGSNDIPTKDMRTLLGAQKSHEMVVLGHCSSEELDYVTNQLRLFSRQAP